MRLLAVRSWPKFNVLNMTPASLTTHSFVDFAADKQQHDQNPMIIVSYASGGRGFGEEQCGSSRFTQSFLKNCHIIGSYGLRSRYRNIKFVRG